MSHSPTWLRTDKLALSTPFVSIFHTSVTWAMDIQYALYFPFDLRGASVFHSGWIPGQCQHRGLLSIRAPRLVYLLRRLKKWTCNEIIHGSIILHIYFILKNPEIAGTIHDIPRGHNHLGSSTKDLRLMGMAYQTEVRIYVDFNVGSSTYEKGCTGSMGHVLQGLHPASWLEQCCLLHTQNSECWATTADEVADRISGRGHEP